MELVKSEETILREEEIFQMMMNWLVVHHPELDLKAPKNKPAIRRIVEDFLPYIRFPVMNYNFLCNVACELLYSYFYIDIVVLLLSFQSKPEFFLSKVAMTSCTTTLSST